MICAVRRHQLLYESAAMNRATSLYLDLARFIGKHPREAACL